MAYRRERRLLAAAALLQQSEDPVRVIAATCGWDDPLRFSAVFKQRFGKSPKYWRKE